MTPDTVVLVAIFVVGAFVGMRVEGFLAKQRRAAWKRRNPGKWVKRGRDGKPLPFQPKADALPAKVPDAADQLRRVMRADFKAQPLLNKSEARLFRAMDKMVIELAPPGWHPPVCRSQTHRRDARGRGRKLPDERKARLEDESKWTRLQDSGYEFKKASCK